MKSPARAIFVHVSVPDSWWPLLLNDCTLTIHKPRSHSWRGRAYECARVCCNSSSWELFVRICLLNQTNTQDKWWEQEWKEQGILHDPSYSIDTFSSLLITVVTCSQSWKIHGNKKTKGKTYLRERVIRARMKRARDCWWPLLLNGYSLCFADQGGTYTRTVFSASKRRAFPQEQDLNTVPCRILDDPSH